MAIDGNLKGSTISCQSGPGSNCNKGVLYIPQSSGTGASQLDGLVSLVGDCAEIHLAYSTVLAEWAGD